MSARHNAREHEHEDFLVDHDESSSPASATGLGRPEELPQADEFDFEGGRPGLRSINQGTLLIILVAVLAAGALYAMRATHSDLKSGGVNSAVEAKIEQALAKLTRPDVLRSDDPLLTRNLAQLFADTDAIISLFAIDPADQQIPMAELKKNPFRLHRPAEAHDPEAELRAAERERARLRKQLTDEYQALRLQSVAAGRMPIAMIGNNMYREGDRLGSFVVRRIRTEELAVELLAEDMLFVLRMKTNGAGEGMRRDIFGRGN
jgi:hypothetical protein